MPETALLHPTFNAKQRVLSSSSLIVSWAVAGKSVLVVGADAVAASRAVFAAEAGAVVTVVAPFVRISSALKQALAAKKSSVSWIDREFESSDLDNAKLVFVCIEDCTLARKIGSLCRERSIPVNVSTAAELSDFYFMSTYKDQSLQVAISTNGNGPRLASKLRKQIVNSIPSYAGAALESLALLRRQLKLADPSSTSNSRRMAFLNKVSESWSIETLANISDRELSLLVDAYVSGALDLPKLKIGALRVVNTGGIENVDDLTVGTFRALTDAELVLADSDISKKILNVVTGDLMIIASDAENASESMMYAALRALDLGQTVIRLKSNSCAQDDSEIAFFAQRGYNAIFPPPFGSQPPSSVEKLSSIATSPTLSDELHLSFGVIPEPLIPSPVSAPVINRNLGAGIPKLISGQDAAAHIGYALSDISFIYPVLPESSLGKSISEWSAKGIKNIHGKEHNSFIMETRLGAGTVVHGAAFDGSTVSVFANSAALSHMLPSMYDIGSQNLPVVLHVEALGVRKESFEVYSTVADVFAASFTGFSVIGSTNVKEAHDISLIAHVVTQAARIPFLHFYDGSHVALEQSVVPIIDIAKLGTVFSAAVEQASALRSVSVPDLVESVMNHLAVPLGHSYKIFEYVGSSVAEVVVVALGSAANIAEDAVLKQTARGYNTGLLKIRLLRPWSSRHFLAALPRTIKKIVLIDDSKKEESVSHGALFLDVTSAFYDSVWSLPIPTILKGNFARGIEHFNAESVEHFLQNMHKFTTVDFLLESPQLVQHAVQKHAFEAILWDQQTDGTESVADHAVSLLRSQGSSAIQVFRATSSVSVEPISATHIRFGDITRPSISLITTANYVAVHNISLLQSFNVAESIRESGLLLLNRPGANPTLPEIEKEIPASTRKTLATRKIRIAVIDADKIAFNYTLFRGKRNEYRNLVLVGLLGKLLDGIDKEWVLNELETSLGTTETDNTVYRTKLGALRTALKSVAIFESPREWALEFDLVRLPSVFQPTIGIKKISGLDDDVAADAVGKAVAKYEPAMAIMFKEAYETSLKLRPEAAEKTFQVKVTENRRLTPETYERNVFHIEFDIGSSGLKYDIGEALGVYGENDPDEVDAFIKWYGLDGAQIVRFDRTDEITGKLRTEYRTVAQLFTQIVDLFGKPGKKFFQALTEHAKDMPERERIGFLGSGEGSDSLAKMQEEETITYADVLYMFPSAHPNIETLLSLIPNIKPRHYSISSSMNVHKTSVHLLVVVVDWTTKSGKQRTGQCTRYLVGLKPGSLVTVSVKPSVMKLPASHEVPVIMAGLGTGMAPFRAFVEERAYQKAIGNKVGPMVLYFGARYRAEEYIYGEELEAYHADGVLSYLRLAFSRDQKEKVYIQHKIKADDSMLGRMMLKEGGAFYLCGPTWPVPDVKDALVSAFSKFMTKDKAAEKLEALKEEERYILEVY